MRKITLFFTVLAMLLATATGSIAWRWWRHEPFSPNVQGASAVGSQARPERSRVIDAAAAVVWDKSAVTLIWQQNAFERRPIASLTKLMTAMVALDHGLSWEQAADIRPDEYGLGGNLLLQNGEAVTMRDLFTASLLGSANNATRAYVRALGISEEEFVRRMNRKAITLGWEQMHFTDVTGLSAGNVATAYEVARLAETAFSNYPDIAQATSQAEYSFTVAGSGRSHTIKNTNRLVADGQLPVIGSKTGYLDEAKYCLVVAGNGDIGDTIVVVLGSPSQEASEQQVYKLFDLTR